VVGELEILGRVVVDTGEVEKTYIQNGILGFWISDQEIKDLYLLLSYYINIEEISNIK
jgi:hypothetical protein